MPLDDMTCLLWSNCIPPMVWCGVAVVASTPHRTKLPHRKLAPTSNCRVRRGCVTTRHSQSCLLTTARRILSDINLISGSLHGEFSVGPKVILKAITGRRSHSMLRCYITTHISSRQSHPEFNISSHFFLTSNNSLYATSIRACKKSTSAWPENTVVQISVANDSTQKISAKSSSIYVALTITDL